MIKNKVIVKILDDISGDGALGGHSYSEVMTSRDKCVTCKEPDLKFRDHLSSKEYGISGMCQTCQDKVFGAD